MKSMKLFETTLPQMYSKALFEEKCFDLAPEHSDKMFDILFTGAANLLRSIKSLEKPVACVIRDLKGNLVAGSVCQYFKNEDESQPGNFSLVWTFDEADIPENALVVSIDDTKTHSYFIAVAGSKYGIKFKDASCIVNTLSYTVGQLKKWLDENAKEGEIISVELDGIFQGRVEVQNGVKVFAVEPDGEIKNLIKDDAAIEEK